MPPEGFSRKRPPGFVAPQSKIPVGYSPSSRLAIQSFDPKTTPIVIFRQVLQSNNPPDLALLMDLYKVLVFQFMRDKGPTEDCIRQGTPMLRTITSYEQNLSRQNHRERALKLKESEHELEMAEAARKDAEELAEQEAAKEFDAHQFTEAESIAEANKRYTRDVDILNEHYDVIMPDEKNPVARVYEKVPGINPLGLTITPREPGGKTNPPANRLSNEKMVIQGKTIP